MQRKPDRYTATEEHRDTEELILQRDLESQTDRVTKKNR